MTSKNFNPDPTAAEMRAMNEQEISEYFQNLHEYMDSQPINRVTIQTPISPEFERIMYILHGE